MNKTYLFFGDSGEYSLHPLFLEMQRRGFDCVEWDISKNQKIDEIFAALSGKKIVFLTSAHVFLDAAFDETCHKGKKYKVISANEVKKRLKPEKSVFIPHDILDGYTHFDRHWFSLFDLYFSPLPNFGHGRRFCEVVEAGWIKKPKPTKKISLDAPPTFAFCFSEGSYYFQNGGTSLFMKAFKPILDEKIPVRLYPGIRRDGINDKLHAQGTQLLDTEESIFDLIDRTSVVLSNAISGANIDASLSGRMVLHIIDESCSEELQRQKLALYPNIFMMSADEVAQTIRKIRTGEIPVAQGEDLIKPFDFDLAIKKITEE